MDQKEIDKRLTGRLPRWVGKDFKWKGETNQLTLQVDTDGLNFDQLAQLSDLFGTRKINFTAEKRDGGFCDTCSFTYVVTLIYISGITKWPESEVSK